MHGSKESYELEENAIGEPVYSKVGWSTPVQYGNDTQFNAHKLPSVGNLAAPNIFYGNNSSQYYSGHNQNAFITTPSHTAHQNLPSPSNQQHYYYQGPYQQQSLRDNPASLNATSNNAAYNLLGNYDVSGSVYSPSSYVNPAMPRYLPSGKEHDHSYPHAPTSPSGHNNNHHNSLRTTDSKSRKMPSSPTASYSGGRADYSYSQSGSTTSSTAFSSTFENTPKKVSNVHNNREYSIEESTPTRINSTERQVRELKKSATKTSSNSSTEWVSLDMSDMKLRSLTPLIKYYSQLVSLYLQKNAIQRLPAEIGLLIELRILDLSDNLLTTLVPEIGKLIRLTNLNVSNNRITHFPVELGNCFRIELFSIKGNPIESQLLHLERPALHIKSLRENLPLPPALAPRSWILNCAYDRQLFKSYLDHWESYLGPEGIKYTTTEGDIQYKELHLSFAPPDMLDEIVKKNRVLTSLRLMCFNVLADLYARSECATYCCPLWALDWEYRKGLIIKEILKYAPDVVCLQEVETEQYQHFFEPELAAHGYRGFFHPKSRSRSIKEGCSRVDGCATFYLFDSFDLMKVECIDFREDAQLYNKFQLNEFKRLISKDNVSLAVLLRRKKHCEQLASMNCLDEMKFEDILVVNTHIHWDPRFCDVKIMQVKLLLDRIGSIVQKYPIMHKPLPILIAGDFNSVPNSAVYELLSKGFVSIQHEEFMGYDYGFPSDKGPEHHLILSSSRSFVGQELVFTNFTPDFVGCLDYIWYSSDSLIVERILDGFDEKVIEEMSGALPNSYMPSDHIPLVADFVFKQFAQSPSKYHVQQSPYSSYRYH